MCVAGAVGKSGRVAHEGSSTGAGVIAMVRVLELKVLGRKEASTRGCRAERRTWEPELWDSYEAQMSRKRRLRTTGWH
jgi:hypothetical protein